LPRVQVHELEYQAGLGILAAATHGRGMWQLEVVTPPLPAPPRIEATRLTVVAMQNNVEMIDDATDGLAAAGMSESPSNRTNQAPSPVHRAVHSARLDGPSPSFDLFVSILMI
jgi:hypothetical protein